MPESSLQVPIGTGKKEKIDRYPDQVCVTDLKPGEHGQIMAIDTRDEATLHKMMALGILPGSPFRLLRRFPAFVFEIGYRQMAVDEEIAKKIYVRR